MKPMLHNGETGDWVGTFEGHKGAVYCSAMNAEATMVVTGSGDYSAILWDALKGTLLHQWHHPHYIKSCDWWESRISTGSFDGHVRIYDVTRPDADPVVLHAHDKSVKACYFVSSIQGLVTASESTVCRWDLRTPQTSAVTKELAGLNVLEYTHRHDLVAAHGKNITLLNPMTLSETSTIVTTDDVECASLSPDGMRLAVGSKLKAKEMNLQGEELETHRGHHGPIFHIRWAPDNLTYASGAEDGMVRIWPSHDVIQSLQGQ